jgi:hypothetical protein
MQEVAGRTQLEVDLPELRELDGIRTRAGAMAGDGALALAQLIRDRVANRKWEDEGLIHRAIAGRVAIESGKSEFKDALTQLLVTTKIEDLEADKFGVLTAAQVVRASIAIPSQLLGSLALGSWYLIFREFFGTPRNESSAGGARVGDLSGRTAYVTCECLGALLDLRQALLNTASYFDTVAELTERLKELAQPGVNVAWCDVERQRLITSGAVSLSVLAGGTALDLPRAPSLRDDFAEFASNLTATATDQLSAAKARISSVISEVRYRRSIQYPDGLHRRRASDVPIVNVEEASKTKELLQKASESSHGHTMGIELLERAMAHAEGALENARIADWRRLAGDFRLVAKGLYDRLKPTQAFLSSVIDRQITAKLTKLQGLPG